MKVRVSKIVMVMGKKYHTMKSMEGNINLTLNKEYEIHNNTIVDDKGFIQSFYPAVFAFAESIDYRLTDNSASEMYANFVIVGGRFDSDTTDIPTNTNEPPPEKVRVMDIGAIQKNVWF